MLSRFYKKGIVPPKKCKECGKEFYRTLNIEAKNWKKQTLCSKDCKGKYQNKILCEGLINKLENKDCAMCGIEFQPVNQAHRFCGSKKYKTGCSRKWDLLKKAERGRKARMYGSRKLWRNTTKIIR